MTVSKNRERGHAVDTAACDRGPLERVTDDCAAWFDLEYTRIRREWAEKPPVVRRPVSIGNVYIGFITLREQITYSGVLS